VRDLVRPHPAGVEPVEKEPARSPAQDGPWLPVASVARRLGVAPATLRTWDRRYGLGPSVHETGTRRRYTAVDLARLTLMRQLMMRGAAAQSLLRRRWCR
jgi:transposase-like protein